MSSPARLVLIEDNDADVCLLQQAFTELQEPYELTVLSDGEAALRYLDEQAHSSAPAPCLVILDLYLPRYNGMEILQVLRSCPELAHLQVAVVTTVASLEQEAELQKLAVRVYRKPVDWDECCKLSRTLLDLCHDQHRRAAANA